MTYILHTLGYERRSIDEFVGLLVEANIDVLVDVRETAWSHKPGFSKGALEQRLRKVDVEYIHASFAGNPRWLRREAPAHADCLAWYDWYLDEFHEIVESFDDLIRELAELGLRACLTCFERHADDCHRGILASRWQARRCGVAKHLATDGLPRRATLKEVLAARKSLGTTFR